jgi:hypothetical protein
MILDPLPFWSLFPLFFLLALGGYEVGYRAGRWWQRRTPDEKEGATGMLVGSLLALLAFLLAVSTGFASDRFDARRGLVLSEANAIGTTFLRAGYLPAPYDDEIQDLLREYTPLRVTVPDDVQLAANIARSEEIHAELWARAETLAREYPESDTLAIFIESLNEMIDLHTSRVVVGYARVPETVIYLLVVGSMLALGMAGYNAGLSRRRSLLGASMLILVMGAVVLLVIDLDRARSGFLTVSQGALVDLAEDLGPPAP